MSSIADCSLVCWPEARSTRRSATCGCVTLRERHSLGAAERCSLEEFAALFPFVRHLLAAFCAMVQRGRLGPRLATAGELAGSSRGCRPAARLRRWHVCLGKKGDFAGPTKRRKGSNRVLLVNGSGLPLPIDVVSQSCGSNPHRAVARPGGHALRRPPPDLRAADSDPFRQRLTEHSAN